MCEIDFVCEVLSLSCHDYHLAHVISVVYHVLCCHVAMCLLCSCIVVCVVMCRVLVSGVVCCCFDVMCMVVFVLCVVALLLLLKLLINGWIGYVVDRVPCVCVCLFCD